MSDSMRGQKAYSSEAQIDWVERQQRRLRGSLPKPKRSEAEFELGVGASVAKTLDWNRRHEAEIRRWFELAYPRGTDAAAQTRADVLTLLTEQDLPDAVWTFLLAHLAGVYKGVLVVDEGGSLVFKPKAAGDAP